MMMVIYLLLHDIFIGSFQKRTISHPQKKFLPSRKGEGNHIKVCLELVQDVHKEEGGRVVNFLHRRNGYFLKQPILWKHKQKITVKE